MFGLFYFRDVSLCVGACGSRVDFVARFPSHHHILSIVLRCIVKALLGSSAQQQKRQRRENRPNKPPERVAHFLAGYLPSLHD